MDYNYIKHNFHILDLDLLMCLFLSFKKQNSNPIHSKMLRVSKIGALELIWVHGLRLHFRWLEWNENNRVHNDGLRSYYYVSLHNKPCRWGKSRMGYTFDRLKVHMRMHTHDGDINVRCIQSCGNVILLESTS